MYEKLKSYLCDDALFMACLILMVGIISFGLGRQSVLSENSYISTSKNVSEVVFYDVNENVESRLEKNDMLSQRVVASKSGTKYHLLDCPGVSQIKEENKIYFNSIEYAEAAGYLPAANCPGI